MPDETRNYLLQVLDLLEQKSVRTKHINWNTFRQEVMEKAKDATSIKGAYPAIIYAIEKLNDHHSYFKPADTTSADITNNPLPVLPNERTPYDIGYIRLSFCIGNEAQQQAYISAVQNSIKQQCRQNLKGWVIDLRGNFGGNMWPMLLAVEPFIGNDTAGYFIDAGQHAEAWILRNGKAYIDDVLVCENLHTEKLETKGQYIAILTDSATASSGEAMAVAFRQRKNVRSFGTPTFGVSTGCVAHILPDGAVINLAESVFADRNRTPYGSKVIPDMTTNPEKTLQEGIDWIYSQCHNNH